MTSSYQKAGVNLDLARNVKSRLPALLRRATRPEVLGGIGAFGGLFRARFPSMREPVLVASVDGVGTKLRVAVEMKRHDTVGQDLVNHCVNDIAVMGADPLFFLDYIGTGKLEPRVFESVVAGLARACAADGVALLGGETAQMPGMYGPGDYDLVGCIVGAVDRRKIIDGSRIRPGDAIIGLASTGLHTNGYSLARRILFQKLKLKGASRPRELGGASVGELLLRVHRNYHPFVAQLRRKGLPLHGAAHITGGGFGENIERVLPRNCVVRIQRDAWKVPPLFAFLQRGGQVSTDEMYRVFNMGVGMVLVVPDRAAPQVQGAASRMRIPSYRIGRIARGPRSVVLE